MVNLEWYRTFKAIYTAGTLTGAAKELLISQPNVSQHLAALENYTGKPLFERTARKMIPTPLGKELYTRLVAPLQQLEAIEDSFQKNALKLDPTISIGTAREFFHANIAPRIAKATYKFHFDFDITATLLQKLQKGQIDFVIANQKKELAGIQFDEIFTEHLILVGSPKLNIKPLKKLIAAAEPAKVALWLEMQKWLAYSSDLALIRRFWLVNFQSRPQVHPNFIIPDLDSIAKTIVSTKSLSVLPGYLVKNALKDKQLIKIWPGYSPVTNTIYLAYNRSMVTSEQKEAIFALLRK